MTTTVPPRLVLPVSARDHVRGPAQAPVTLVEYGDFECPFCGLASWESFPASDAPGWREHR